MLAPGCDLAQATDGARWQFGPARILSVVEHQRVREESVGFEHKELGGSLFPNERKTNGGQPGWKGAALIGGVEYWISGWVNKTKAGDKWISLAFEVKQARPMPSGDAKPAPSGKDNSEPLNDPLPF